MTSHHGKKLAYYPILLVTLGFILPTIIYQHPFGTDTYNIVYRTGLLQESTGVKDFYQKSVEDFTDRSFEEYSFGVWVFGSIVSDLTGLTPLKVSIIVPVLWVILSSAGIFILSRVFTDHVEDNLLTVIFFLTMPTVTTNLLAYQTRTIVLPLSIISLAVFLHRKISVKQKTILFSIISSFLIIIHPPTAMIIIFLLMSYIVVNSFVRIDEQVKTQVLVLGVTVTVWALIMKSFETIYNHYIYDLQVLEKIITYLPGKLQVIGLASMNILEYSNLQYLPIAYLIFGLTAISISKLTEKMHLKQDLHLKALDERTVSLSAISLTAIVLLILVAHSVITEGVGRHMISQYTLIGSLFRLGPIHIFLLPLGLIKSDKRIILLFLLLSMAIIPTAVTYGGYTGTTRRIWYYIFVIPVMASIGLVNLLKTIKFEWMRDLLLVGVLLVLLSSAVIGNTYFAPRIAETLQERKILNTIDKVFEDKTFLAQSYRQRLELYGGVKDINLYAPSSQVKRCWSSLLTDDEGENFGCLRSLGVNYMIRSDRTLKSLGENERLTGDLMLNRLYSSDDIEVYELN